MKADPFVQARLLELQALDTRLQQIAHARTRLPQIAALEQARAQLQRAQDDVVRAETTLGDIRREVARTPVQLETGPRQVTASVGVALLRPHEPWGNLADAAEAACIRAKQGGRNRVAPR